MRRAVLLAVGFAFLGFVGATAAVSAEPGVVDGVAYDEEFGYEGELSDEQLEDIVSRAMARVEHLRGVEFEARPSVERTDSLGGGDDGGGGDGEGNGTGRFETNVTRNDYGDWNNVVWEALLIVGDDEYANQAIADTFGGATQGFYQPGSRNATNSSASDGGHTDGGTVTIVGGLDEPTLAHELVHVLQDQRYNLSAERFNPPVQDEQLASDGLTEGEAQYIRQLYQRRCASGWECYTSGGAGGGGGASGGGSQDGRHVGVLMTILQPYSDGAEYVHRIRQRGGWGAVEDRYDEVPTTTREIIHHERYERTRLGYDDEARGNWTTFDDIGRRGYDVAGEASIFVTFWYQSSPLGYGHNVVDTRGFFSPDGEFDLYSYESEVSDGWAGDRIYPYKKNATNETGFVWKSVWETADDAEEFASAYLAVLDAHGATRVDNATVRVESDFRGAYRVARSGKNVTVVHGPTVGALNELRPSVSDAQNPVNKPIDARPTEATPGFTGAAALAALLALAVLLVRRP